MGAIRAEVKTPAFLLLRGARHGLAEKRVLLRPWEDLA